MQEARAAGCQTAAEANRFIAEKRRKTEETALRIRESSEAGPSGKGLQKPNHLKGELDGSPLGVVRGSMDLHPGNKDSSLAIQSITSSLDDWDITGLAGADLLSDTVSSNNFHCFKWLVGYSNFHLCIIISIRRNDFAVRSKYYRRIISTCCKSCLWKC